MKLYSYLEASLSKTISYHLRHNKNSIHLLGMETNGGSVDFWVFYNFLLKNFKNISPADITNIVRRDSKQRFSIECYKDGLILDYFEIFKEIKLNTPQLKENTILNKLKNIFQIKIKANQGHSIKEVIPDLTHSNEVPSILYHGTSEEKLKSIMETGLHPGERHHVHLTADASTAKKRGSSVIAINTKKMIDDGWIFLVSRNNVYFPEKGNTKTIPTKFLKEV